MKKHFDGNWADAFLPAAFTTRRTVPSGTSPPPVEVQQPMHVVTVYAGPLECEWAMQTHGTLLQVVEEDCDLRSRWWSVDSLREPNSLVAAVRTAVEAQLIIIAISDAGELSPALTEWIEQWLPGKFDRNSGLVALIRKVSPRAEASVSIREHFRRVAKAAGMAFFVSERSWGDAVSARQLTGPQGVHRGPRFSWDEYGGGHGILRWGINE